MSIMGVSYTAAEKVDDASKKAGLQSELPFYIRPVEVLGFEMYPLTIAFSLLVGTVVIKYLSNAANTSISTASASHILIKDSSVEGRKQLEKLKKDIQDEPMLFAKAATQYSECPSGKKKFGHLGSFKQGQMVPPFDRVVFDPKSEVGVVLGPVQTHFGWHLILIHKRYLAKPIV